MDIRPFRSGDRAAIVEIDNRDTSLHLQWSVAAWEADDALHSPAVQMLRLAAGEPTAVGYVSVTDEGTAPRRREGVCSIDLIVAHECRRHGLGTALYERALTWAQERGARRLTTWFMEHGPGDPAVAFFRHHGFDELERSQPSSLDLAAWDPARFAGAIERATWNGVRLFTYAEAGDTDDNRRRLYALAMPINHDMPRNDPDPGQDAPFEDWVKRFERPDWTPELQFLAEKDGQWVGLTKIGQLPDKPHIGRTWSTGVLREHRGQGIALALKVAVLETARERGIRIVATDNHEDNAPMLAINRKLGFVADPAWVCYNKALSETQGGSDVHPSALS